MRIWLPVAFLAMALASPAMAQSQPVLQLQGQPYFGGSMKLHLTGATGQPALLAYGLNPLPLEQPLSTGKGPWYVGALVNLVALGNIPSSGRIDLPFTMPPEMPALAGIPIVMQGYVPWQLSNPTTVQLDEPYYVSANATTLQSTNPTELGLFGDRVAIGDLNADGETDIAVSAWFENAGGLTFSGRAYVFWGPSLATATTLEPPAPKYYGVFGEGLGICDLNGDGIDDLIISEGNGDPPPPTDPGHLYLYSGGTSFAATPTATVSSAGTGTPYQAFGHIMAIGDFNDDGSPDAAIGEGLSTVQGFANAGQVEIRFGPDLLATQIVAAPDLSESGFLGDRLAAADVTGDGIDDLIVGAPRKKLGGLIAMGRVYLFTGPSLAHFKTIDHPLPSGANSRFGNAVVGADLNGDGIAEVIATDQRNHAFIFWSPAFDDYLLITRPPDPVTGTAISVSFGYFAATGDVNGDDLVDVIVGDPFADSTGRVYAALAPFFADSYVLIDKVPESLAEFGWGLTVSDIDGDGRAELIVGSDTADPSGIASAGRVTIFDFDP
jgi:hypothetical protein